MDDDRLNRLRDDKEKTNMRTFASEVSYNILSNIQYRIKFQYDELAERIYKKDFTIEDLMDPKEDVIVRLLNLNEMCFMEKNEEVKLNAIEDLEEKICTEALVRKCKKH